MISDKIYYKNKNINDIIQAKDILSNPEMDSSGIDWTGRDRKLSMTNFLK